MSSKSEINALLRNDLALFIERTFRYLHPEIEYMPNWHIQAIAHALERCHRRECKRLIITIPPRYLKSISASVAFSAWVLGHNPECNILAASYAQELSTLHHNNTRKVLESEWYRETFPATKIDAKKNTQSDLRTTKFGGRYATSVGGTSTGLGGNIIIIDDPHKTDEVESDIKRENVIEWFRSVILTRLNNKNEDVIILIQQRQHEYDLAGYLLESGDWQHLDLPAIATEEQIIPIGDGVSHIRLEGDVLHPERESMHLLEEMRRAMGSYAFAAQYQQTPAPRGGELIKWEWFQFYNLDCNSLPPGRIYQTWDTAHTVKETSDYSVGITFLQADRHIYVLDVFRKRMLFPELKAKVIELAYEFGAFKIIIEGTNAGIDLREMIFHETHLPIYYYKPVNDKVARITPYTVLIEDGKVLLPKNAPWLPEFQREMVLFPKGKHDDQVDALQLMLRHVARLYLKRSSRPDSTHNVGSTPRFSANDVFTMPIQ